MLREQGAVLTVRAASHRAAVLGFPVSHSLSPTLHQAAYAALGLCDWSYDAVEVRAPDLARHVAGLDTTWRGLSLTMPLKEVAFDVADEVDVLAAETGAINTLVRGGGWTGSNTDVHGILAACADAGVGSVTSALVIGSGATARSATAALRRLSARQVTFMVRGAARTATLAQAVDAGLEVAQTPLGVWPDSVDLVISTVPPAATGSFAADLPSGGRALLEVTYSEGLTPLMSAARASGYAVVPGTEMLLHQAAEQVRLMTGHPAPLAAMRTALAAATEKAAHPT